jgi:uncharacterized protein
MGSIETSFWQNFSIYIFVGFIAQMISGTLGMAYGVSGTLFLLSMGFPTSTASASIHTAKVVTSFVSGISHLFRGNVDKKIFMKLIVPGAIGGVSGSLLLSNFNGDILRPFIYAYLLYMGIRIIITAYKESHNKNPHTGNDLNVIGLLAGFLDALGGGGWGPIVTTSLISRGYETHKTVGTVDASKFVVALVQVITFSIFITISHWPVVIGLIIGGVIAAPIAAKVCGLIHPKKLMFLVGVLIIITSLVSIILSIQNGYN